MNDLRAWALRERIRVYLLEAGEPCAASVEDVAVKFAIVGQAAELDPKISKSDSRLVKIREGIPTLQGLIYSDSWTPEAAPKLDEAIEATLSLRQTVNPFSLNLVQITMKEYL